MISTKYGDVAEEALLSPSAFQLPTDYISSHKISAATGKPMSARHGLDRSIIANLAAAVNKADFFGFQWPSFGEHVPAHQCSAASEYDATDFIIWRSPWPAKRR